MSEYKDTLPWFCTVKILCAYDYFKRTFVLKHFFFEISNLLLARLRKASKQ